LHIHFACFQLSYNTIRELCNEEVPKMEEWSQKSTDIKKQFIAAPGNVEVTMDETCVNHDGGDS